MANYRVLLAFLLVLLIFFSLFLWLSNTSRGVRVQQAEDMTASLKSYFRMIDYRCAEPVSDFVGHQACINSLIDEYKIVVDMEEDEFKNFNTKTNATGYVVLINEGRNPMESGMFSLLLNKKVMDEGCIISESIDPGYSCRLNFNSYCDKGDVLEVVYDEKRAHIRNC